MAVQYEGLLVRLDAHDYGDYALEVAASVSEAQPKYAGYLPDAC
jgi:hypothetical protein